VNSSETDRLFARRIAGGYENDDASDALASLRANGSREIFEQALAWSTADDPMKRARSLDILCQLRRASGEPRNPQWLYREESFKRIMEMLAHEQVPMVLDSAVSALGHLGNEAGIPMILRYSDHPDRDVRFAATFALGCFPNDPRSVDALLTLTTDSDSEVRDWATFGLGVQGDADSPEIREALLRCLNDGDQDVREEAAVGLAKRRDQRVLPTLIEMLNEPDFSQRVADAASALLELDRDPPDWTRDDYLSALRRKFNPATK